MASKSGSFLSKLIPGVLPFLLSALAACSGGADEPSDPVGSGDGDGDGSGGLAAGTGGAATGTGGAFDAGTGGNSTVDGGTGGASSAATCFQIASTTFLNFDSYDGMNQSFLVAGEDVNGVYMGPWELNDENETGNEDPAPTYAIEMVEGFGATGYALRVSDDEAKVWGGGVGFWMTNCVDAATYSGIRLQVRGTSPTGTVRVEVATKDTEPPSADGAGACMGAECANAAGEFTLPLTADEWTQIDLPWSAFEPGVGSGGVAAPMSGFGIVGLIFSMSVQYDEVGPVPGPYDLTVDEIGFF